MPEDKNADKDATEVAEEQGTRVWNAWEGDTPYTEAQEAAAELQEEQIEEAEAQADERMLEQPPAARAAASERAALNKAAAEQRRAQAPAQKKKATKSGTSGN